MIFNKKRELIILGVLVIIYFVGIIGISIPTTKALTVSLTPLNLIITGFLFIFGMDKIDLKFIIIAFLVFIIGFFVEVIGVKTGLLFGEYYYGQTLGLKIFDVPLVMGINWFLLSFCTIGIYRKTTSNSLLIILLASITMVGLDFLIEPVAISLDFWNWSSISENGTSVPDKNYKVPTQNYFMWFLVSMLVNTLVQIFVKKINFSISAIVFSIQLVFFIILNIIL